MKFWRLTLCAFVIPMFAVFLPGNAQASVTTSPLTSGKSVTVTVSSPGQQPTYTFAGHAGHHVTFQVTKFHFTSNGSGGSLYLNFFEPASSSSYTSCFFSSNSYCDFTPPQGGTWSVQVSPNSSAVGSMTLAFAGDVARTALKSGTAVSTAIKFQGQNAGYTFSARAGHHVTFQVTKFHFTSNGSGGSMYLYFFEPASSSSYTSCFFSSNSYCDFTPPQGGTWSVRTDPNNNATGSLTLTFANDVGVKPFTGGKTIGTTIKFQGQNSGYTFAGKRGHHVTFQVTKFHLTSNGSGGSMYLYFFEPGSSSSYTSCFFSSNSYCDFTPPQGGTWSVRMDPNNNATGSLSLTFANDVAVRALKAGKAVSTAIKFQGQNAGYTFSASAHKRVTFHVSSFHFTDEGSGGSVYLYFFEPGSSSNYTSCFFSSNSSCTFATPTRGTWRVRLDPNNAAIGSLKLKLTRP